MMLRIAMQDLKHNGSQHTNGTTNGGRHVAPSGNTKTGEEPVNSEVPSIVFIPPAVAIFGEHRVIKDWLHLAYFSIDPLSTSGRLCVPLCASRMDGHHGAKFQRFCAAK